MSDNNNSSMWSGRLAFILAATGSAVGLGNIWKFPYITGENGGGAFVLVYLLCVALIGIPIMMSEIMLGRRGGHSPIKTLTKLSQQENASPVWKYLGWMGVLAGALILSYYSVIAGWAMAYIFRSFGGVFEGASAEVVGNIFNDLIASPEKLLAWHTIFMVLTIWVVAQGIKSGIEKAVKYLLPGLFVILLILVGYAMDSGDFSKGVSYLFAADFSAIKKESILTAMGHAFFTLSLGMGAIMVYGSYLPKNISIAKTSIAIAFLDTLVALLAGLAIFPIVFANGLEPAKGPGLIFNSLPIAFGSMPYGTLFATLFFILLFFAAWSSSVSLIEPLIAYLMERKKISRVKASLGSGLAIWLLGLGSVFSFNIWSDIKWSLNIGSLKFYQNATFFDVLDYITANIMLPLGGLFVAIFAGWVMKKQSSVEELAVPDLAYSLWMIAIKFITPVAVVIIFLKSLNIL